MTLSCARCMSTHRAIEEDRRSTPCRCDCHDEGGAGVREPRRPKRPQPPTWLEMSEDDFEWEDPDVRIH